MTKHKSVLKRLELFITIFLVIAFFIITLAAYKQLDKALDENVSRRALAELKSTADEQAAQVSEKSEQNLEPLNYLSKVIEGGASFGDTETRTIIEAFAATYHWKTVGYAEGDGEAADSYGTSLGNISSRAYFTDILYGEAETVIDYIEDTNLCDGAAFVISTSCGENGILFVSIADDAWSSMLLGNAESDSNNEIYIINADGTVMLCNATGGAHINGGTNFFRHHEEGSYNAGMDEDTLRLNMQRHESGSYVYHHEGGDENVVYRWTGIGDWYVMAMSDVESSQAKYAGNMLIIERLVQRLLIIFAAVMAILTGITFIYLHFIDLSEKKLKFEKLANAALMKAANVSEFIYDVKKGTAYIEESAASPQAFPLPRMLETVVSEITGGEAPTTMESKDMVECIRKAIETNETQTLDRPMELGNALRWMRMLFVPYIESGNKTTHVFCAVMDVTSMHNNFENGIMKNCPSATIAAACGNRCK